MYAHTSQVVQGDYNMHLLNVAKENTNHSENGLICVTRSASYVTVSCSGHQVRCELRTEETSDQRI